MARAVKVSVLPAVAALAALFMVLPQQGADATITMRGMRFEPAEIRVEPGARIAFRNDSSVTHTATCVANDCFDGGDLQPGQTKFVEVARAGSLQFVCRYHGRQGMTGRVLSGRAASAEPTPVPSPS